MAAVLLLAAFAGSPASAAASFESEQVSPARTADEREHFQQYAREEQEKYRKRVAIPAEALESKPQLASIAVSPRAAFGLEMDSGALIYRITCSAALLILGTLLVFLRYAPRFALLVNRRFDPWALSPALRRRFEARVRAEEACFAEFLAAFRGPQAVLQPGGGDFRRDLVPGGPGGEKDLHAAAAVRITRLQKLLEEIRWHEKALSSQRSMLEEFLRQLADLKSLSGLEALVPVWQTTSVLQGLLKQLVSKSSYITPSTLRTLGISLELLQELCAQNRPADLASNPPIRLLAVDDDRITRNAMSWALGKALSDPDLAENGESALALAKCQKYDVIFLDVQMPGMDGFELSSRIHATEPNQLTPVVFVTCQSDFDSRAQATQHGGFDLIGKPFLTFEITLVALTLALRRRLQERARPDPSDSQDAGEFKISLQRAPQPAPRESAAPPPLRFLDNAPAGPAAPAPRIPVAPAKSTGIQAAQDELATSFFARAPGDLQVFRALSRGIQEAETHEARREKLEELCLYIHSLTLNAGLAELRSVFQTGSALEGLLRKLVENPGNANASALQSVAAAVDLLAELCAGEHTDDVTGADPVRLLIVDDDPVSRRVLACALQTAFEKPDVAEDGPSALALASQKCYDVIFLDVLMPGMDGFELCPKLHEIGLNGRTPIVFVTGHDDARLVARSAECGGSDFITKPILTAELTVKALVHAMRRRLRSPVRVDLRGTPVEPAHTAPDAFGK